MSILSKIGSYIAENTRLSFAAWSGGYRVGSLIAAVTALVLTGFALATGAIAGVAPSTITGWLTLSGAAWFLFLVLIVTPFRMWDARGSTIVGQDKTIEDLQDQIAAKAVAQKTLEELWRYREAGIILRNERLRTKDDFHTWLRRFEEWRVHALTAAGEVSANLRSRLTFLDQTRPLPDGINPTSAEHAHHLRILSEIVARIGEFQEKHT